MRRFVAALALAALLLLVRKRRAAVFDPENDIDAPYKLEPDPRLYQ